jgi:outer membrane immunogenic protein
MKKLKLKKLALAIVGVFAIGTAAANAADMPQRPLPMPRAPVFVPFFSWSGFYLGINAGYAFGDTNWTNTLTGITTGDFNANGFMAGGTIGYNMQFGSAIFGVEADFDWSGVKGATNANCGPNCETRNTWFATARGRIGYAFDRFMPYVTGGAAFGDVKLQGTGITAHSDTQVGWTAGVGIEYAFLNNWTAKLEYLYADLGSVNCPAANCIVPIEASLQLNIVRGGFNYKF